MDRREFLKGAGHAAAAATLGHRLVDGAQAADGQTGRKPNLVFVLADQWRFSAFGHSTDPQVETPNIDRLASEGARFVNAYATNPVCTPNRSVILTGRYCHQTGMVNNNLMIPPTERCMADCLGDAGYATQYVGKWHLDGEDKPGFVPPGWRRRGFDVFEGFNRGHLYHRSKTFSDEGELIEPNQFEPSYQTDRAISFMEKHQDEPFYLYLSWGPPHTPYVPPDAFDRYSPDDLQWRPNVPAKLRQNRKLRRELAGYYGLCTALDSEMGRLTSAIDRLGLTDDTLLVFTSDHGDMHGSHGLSRKGHPDEESLHVPLLARLPGRIAPGTTPKLQAASLDLMPTLLSLCGVEAPNTCMGRDLSNAVTGGPMPKTEPIYCQGRMQGAREWRAVVTDRHKLSVTRDGSVTHLIDLVNDPYEQENRADDAGSASLRSDLLALLRDTGKSVDDPFPKPATPAKKMYRPNA